MDLAIALIVVLVAAAAIALGLRRATELFFVSVRRGRARVVRGGLPPALLADFQDISRRARIEHASLRAVRRAGGAVALEVSGAVDEAAAQRFRNAFGLVPALRIKSAAASSRRPRGGAGLPRLAWRAESRRRRGERDA